MIKKKLNLVCFVGCDGGFDYFSGCVREITLPCCGESYVSQESLSPAETKMCACVCLFCNYYYY